MNNLLTINLDKTQDLKPMHKIIMKILRKKDLALIIIIYLNLLLRVNTLVGIH